MRTTNTKAMLFTHNRTVRLPAMAFTARPRERATLAGIRLRRISYIAPLVVRPELAEPRSSASESRWWTVLSVAFVLAATAMSCLAL